jgi:hypothetical protein
MQGGGTVERYLVALYHQAYHSHLAQLAKSNYLLPIAGAGEFEYKHYLEFLEPYDVRGSRYLIYRYDDPFNSVHSLRSPSILYTPYASTARTRNQRPLACRSNSTLVLTRPRQLVGKCLGALTDREDPNVVGRHGSGEGCVPGYNYCELSFMINDSTKRAVALLQNTALGGDNRAYSLAASSGPRILCHALSSLGRSHSPASTQPLPHPPARRIKKAFLFNTLLVTEKELKFDYFRL